MHDLDMIDATLSDHPVVVVAPSGLVLAVADDVTTAMRRAGDRLRGSTIYLRATVDVGAWLVTYEQVAADVGATLTVRPGSTAGAGASRA